MYNKPFLISFAITYVLALLSAPVTTQTLEEGCLHVRALFRPPEGSYSGTVYDLRILPLPAENAPRQ